MIPMLTDLVGNIAIKCQSNPVNTHEYLHRPYNYPFGNKHIDT